MSSYILRSINHVLPFQYTLFYKNIFDKNVEAEVYKITLSINPRLRS